MTRIVQLRLWSVLLVPLAAASCSGDDRHSDEGSLGMAQIAITQVPADVQCIQILAQGSRSVVQSYSVASGQSSVLRMAALPTGLVQFSGNAYSTACSSIAGQTPTYTADPVSAQVATGTPASVTLNMRRNGQADVAVDFEGDCIAQGSACAAGQACCSGLTCVSGTCTAPQNSTAPCDIYASASTPCVAAYSMARVVSSTYTGPLYQVRKGGTWSATTGVTGGTFLDIGTVAGGYADSAAQDAFCADGVCTISVLYDQSGRRNDLRVAPAGCLSGTASEPDSESLATRKSFTINGHRVYALATAAHDGYRNNSTTGMPTGTAAQGIYAITDGTRYGNACCWDFGNATTNACSYAVTNSLFFGTGYWGKGAGSGPWFMGDFGSGVWSGGSGASTTTNNNLPSSNADFAFGILKSNASNYAIRVANARTGTLMTAYDGAPPAVWSLQGAIVLGIASDNSNSSFGTFYEGAITSGRPSDATDAAVLANVQAAGYGQ